MPELPDVESFRRYFDKTSLHQKIRQVEVTRPGILNQIGAEDPVAEPREVLDIRRQHELTAGLDAFDQQRLEIGACGVERRGEPGGAGSDDDDASTLRH